VRLHDYGPGMELVEPHDHPVDPERVTRARARGLSAEDAGRPVRARILYALDEVEELCVGDLALALEVTDDAVGYALRLLRTAGLVATRKHGRVVFYRLAADFPAPLRQHCLPQLVAITRTTAGDEEES
jgi:ArsR family transcriptional regulator, lead/cadmium/zinc/bismuth-responsive transcriptional repressor